MQTTITKYTCDICGEKIPAGMVTALKGATPNGKRMQLDLCESCLEYAYAATQKGNPHA